MITTTEAAKILGLTRVTTWHYVKAGRLPATQVGRMWVLDRRDVERFAMIPRKPRRPRKASLAVA